MVVFVEGLGYLFIGGGTEVRGFFYAGAQVCRRFRRGWCGLSGDGGVRRMDEQRSSLVRWPRRGPNRGGDGRAAGGGAGESEALGVVEDGEVLTGERLCSVHAGNTVATEEFDELLLAHGFDLAAFDGLGSDLVNDVGQNRAEAKHVAGAGQLEDHGLAFARCGGDFDLSGADDKDVTDRVALTEEFCAAGHVHHNADAVVIFKGFRREVAEHSQVTMFAVKTIIRCSLWLTRTHNLSLGGTYNQRPSYSLRSLGRKCI